MSITISTNELYIRDPVDGKLKPLAMFSDGAHDVKVDGVSVVNGGVANIDLSGKVDKVTGKGLSTNDYDNAAKAKVDAIPSNPKYTDTVYDDTEIREEIAEQNEDIVSKLTEPNSGLAVGKYFKVASLDENGHAVLEACDLPTANTYFRYGLCRFQYNTGMYPTANYLAIANATEQGINNRSGLSVNGYGAITPYNLVKAVNSVICSTASTEQLGTEEKYCARARLGLEKTLSLDFTVSETLSELLLEFDGEKREIDIRLDFVNKSDFLSANGRIFISLYINGSWVYVARDTDAWLSYTMPYLVHFNILCENGYADVTRNNRVNSNNVGSQYTATTYKNVGTPINGLPTKAKLVCFANYKFVNGDKVKVFTR